MGKSTGFLEYERVENAGQEPLERIKTYREFHTPLSEEDRRKQGARCMDCGVPFCQAGKPIFGMVSGCPLNNLCPEWNDMVYNGFWDEAADRLLLTNCFPEFTSRVCPALCEKACTCGLYGDPVTVKENEYAIIEHAFSTGYIHANPPKVRTGKRVAVVGSGPSGLAAALQLNKRGHHVTVLEREDRVGGLLMYGIPNMKLEKTVVQRRVDMMREEGVEFRTGVDVGKDIWHGCKSVVQLEMMPKLPDSRAENNPWPEWPRVCKTDYGQEEAIAVFGHDPRIYQTTVKRFLKNDKNHVCAVETIKLQSVQDPKTGRRRMEEIPGSEQILDADLVLIAAGFLGAQSYVTDAFGVEVTPRTNVSTKLGHYKTSVDKVFTAGDMHRGQSLVVWAIREGREAAKEVDEFLMGYTNLR